MYINRKDGTLVEAIEMKKYNEQGLCLISYGVYGHYGYTEYTFEDFSEQYGEAMVLGEEEPHIKDFACSQHGCIPYIPEQGDPDEGLEVRPEIIERLEKSRQIPKEELLTSGQMREKLGIEQSNLMLSDEEICSKILHCGKSNIETCRKLEQRCDYLYDIKSGIRAELDHLKGLGIVYVKVKKNCPYCYQGLIDGLNECGNCQGRGVYEVDIPLSDYKGEK